MKLKKRVNEDKNTISSIWGDLDESRKKKAELAKELKEKTSQLSKSEGVAAKFKGDLEALKQTANLEKQQLAVTVNQAKNKVARA